MPFDWKKPFGYSIAIIFQLILFSQSLQFIAYMLSLAIGYYLFAIAQMKEIKNEIKSYNAFLKNKPSQSELLMRLGETIRFSNLKR